MRLLLLNLNYLRYQFFIKTMQNIFEILNTLPNGVTHISCPLSTSKSDKTMQNIFEILNTLPNEVIPYNNTK